MERDQSDPVKIKTERNILRSKLSFVFIRENNDNMVINQIAIF